jgi:hypothetical protein
MVALLSWKAAQKLVTFPTGTKSEGDYVRILGLPVLWPEVSGQSTASAFLIRTRKASGALVYACEASNRPDYVYDQVISPFGKAGIR